MLASLFISDVLLWNSMKAKTTGDNTENTEENEYLIESPANKNKTAIDIDEIFKINNDTDNIIKDCF